MNMSLETQSRGGEGKETWKQNATLFQSHELASSPIIICNAGMRWWNTGVFQNVTFIPGASNCATSTTKSFHTQELKDIKKSQDKFKDQAVFSCLED